MAVLPSYLDADYADQGGAEGSLTDLTLRFGEVVAAYGPNDPHNKGATKGKQWVYIVNVSYRDGVGPRSVVPYRCTVAELFGGVGDHCRHSVRPTDAQARGGKFGVGARVLVACPNGDKSNALIIGSVRHDQDPTPDPDAPFLDFAFNGVKAVIGADGSVTLTVSGPTKVDGTPVGEAKPTSVTLKPDGSVAVSGDNVTVTGSTTCKVTTKTATIEADEVTVKAGKVNLGAEASSINPLDEVVVGSGIDTFTGKPYKMLGSTTPVVKAKK